MTSRKVKNTTWNENLTPVSLRCYAIKTKQEDGAR
jgi:hypothetical protein